MNQPTPMEDDIRRQSPTMNDQLAWTTYNNRKSAYLLIVGNLAINIQYGRQYQGLNNNRQIKLPTPKAKTAKIAEIGVDTIEGLTYSR